MRLNQFIAHAGVCSRRKADQLILAHKIKVNGKEMSDLAYQVLPDDIVSYQGKRLMVQMKKYYLLNKPDNTITTAHDPQGRRTVLDLMREVASERIYPVGRLDRNTTGLLLLTNNGELAHQLAHPSYQIQKTYEVTLKEKVAPSDIKKLKRGVKLADGMAKVDTVTPLDHAGKKLSLTLHSGKNRVIRRLFEALNYQLLALDRVGYAGLTQVGIDVGAWRSLSQKEVASLHRLLQK